MPEATTTASQGARLRMRRFALALAGVAILACFLAPSATAAMPLTRLSYAVSEIVPIPASIPHEDGDMVDRRIIPNLRWISERFPIYVTDGYSGRLPDGEHVGCNRCHVEHSDHYNGLAVDISPLHWSNRCDVHWRGITRLAKWAEPVQNRPRPPFRWVGYDGDAGHGCGNHLHLSWQHSPAPMGQLAEWVEVFSASFQGVSQQPQPQRKEAKPKLPQGPPGGMSTVQAGGVAPRGD